MNNVPEIRFKGYTDAWVQRKLGEVAEHFEYGLNASAKDFDGVHKYIRITDIDDDMCHFSENSLTSPDIGFCGADDYLSKLADIFLVSGVTSSPGYASRRTSPSTL